MNNIVIDMSPIIHGFRAIKRCTACIVPELLKYEGINFDLLYFDYKKKTEKYLKSGEVNINEKVLRVPLRLLIEFWKRFSWPRLEMYLSKYDLFYTNEFYFPPLRKIPILATIHGLHHKVIPEKIPPEAIHSMDQGVSFILKHADYLVAVSETTKRELIQHLGVDPERIFAVTHGVDKYFRQRKNQQAVLNRLKKVYGLKRPYILYAGAVAIHKNVMGILAAYKMLSSRIQHDLVIAGPPDSAWDDAIKFVKDNRLSGRIYFLGNVVQTENNLLDLYNGAELFVFPSFWEAWTSPPLEAMACGTPVIASNCSSLPETVGEAAIQVDPEDTEALSKEMEKVLSDVTLQADMIRKGFEHVSKHTWEKAAEKLIHVFEEILSNGIWEGRKL
jgi:glycosyltransferase involved in cell wall biosynthesis